MSTKSVQEVTTFVRMPKPKQKEFWDARRIEHLRELALTGKAAYLWEDHSESSRVLDRLAFSDIDPAKSNENFKQIRNNPSLI